MGALIQPRGLVIAGVTIGSLAVRAINEGLADFYNRAAIRGDDQMVPYAQGQIPRRRWVDRTRKLVPIQVDGRYTLSDALHADPVEGLQTNLDVLNRTWRPRHDIRSGTSELAYHLADGTVREGRCHILDLAGRPVSDSLWHGVVDLSIPTGVLFGEEITQTLTVGANTVNNPGTAEAFDMVFEFTDAARLENTSWSAVELYLDYTGTTPVTVNTGSHNAIYADTTSAMNEIDYDGHERMFVLEPGDNTVVVTGSAVDLTFSPPYL